MTEQDSTPDQDEILPPAPPDPADGGGPDVANDEVPE
jgi:hypothetical protein